MRKLLIFLFVCSSAGLYAQSAGSQQKAFPAKRTSPQTQASFMKENPADIRKRAEQDPRISGNRMDITKMPQMKKNSLLRAASAEPEKARLDSTVLYCQWGFDQPAYKELFYYDANGNQIKYEYVSVDESGNQSLIESQEREYNEQNKLIKVVHSDLWRGFGYVLEYEYDEYGKRRKEIQNFSYSMYEYSYDVNERCINYKYYAIGFGEEKNKILVYEKDYIYEKDKEIEIVKGYYNPISKDSTVSILDNKRVVLIKSYSWDYDLSEWNEKSYTDVEYENEQKIEISYSWDISLDEWVRFRKYITDPETGNTILEEQYSPDGTITSGYKIETTYENEQEIRIKYNWDTTLKEWIKNYKEVYNPNGTLILDVSYNAESTPTGYADRYTDYAYNKNGDIVLQYNSYSDYWSDDYWVYYYSGIETPVRPALPAYNLSAYPANSPVATNGKLQVDGTQLVNQEGDTVRLRGMSSHGIHWFPDCYTDSSLTALVRDWKINVFRIANYVQEEGYATELKMTKDEWKDRIDSLVTFCERLGIYCIIDWHILNEFSGDPWCNIEDAREFWGYISQKYADKAHVIYEICNEPNDGDLNVTVTWGRVRSYADEIIPIIRNNDKHSVIIVGTPNWSQFVNIAAMAPVVDEWNIMYSLHFYAGSHGEELREYADFALEKGLPIFVTEFGTSKDDGSGGFFRAASQTWIDWMNERNISWVNWSFADKNESSCALTAGSCGDETFNSTSVSGAFIKENLIKAYEEEAGNNNVLAVSAHTVIYPNPTNGILYVDIAEPVLNIDIFDITGKKVKVILSPDNSFDISGLASGVYLIKIRTETRSVTQQMIKK